MMGSLLSGSSHCHCMYQAKKDSIKIGKILMETARRVSKDEKVNWLAINRVKENWYSMACHGTMKPEPK